MILHKTTAGSPVKRNLTRRTGNLKKVRDPAGIRTRDPQLRRLLLYPAELPDLTIWYAKEELKTHQIEPLGFCACKGITFFLFLQILQAFLFPCLVHLVL